MVAAGLPFSPFTLDPAFTSVMRLADIPLDILDVDAPPSLDRSRLAHLVLGNIKSFLTVGDTICVSEYHNCPSIIGRIGALTYCSTDTNEEAVHPHLVGRSLGREEALFKLHLFVPNDNTIVGSSEWNYVPNDVARACRGIVEAAPSNATVWISSNYVNSIVFLLHADQCISQEYGSVAGRSQTYFVRHFAYLSTTETDQIQMDLHPLLNEEYHPFGNIGGPLLTTERYNNFIYQLWRGNRQLLTKVGKVGGFSHIKFPLDEDVFNYFMDRVVEVGGENISISTVNGEMKHGILHLNLSWETKLVECTKVRVKTLNFEGVDALKSLVSKLMGVGVKRKLCGKDDINNINMNPKELQDGDVVNMVDVDLTQYTNLSKATRKSWIGVDHDNDEPFEHYFKEGREHFLMFEYDRRLKEFKFGMKCAALKYGSCTASRLVELVTTANQEWEEVDEGAGMIYLGMSIQHHGGIWHVLNINQSSGVATIHIDGNESQTEIVSITYALENEFGADSD